MSSKAQRRKKLKRVRTRARGVVEVTPSNRDELPRPIRLILESSDDLRRYLQAADGDPERALAIALDEVSEAAQRLAELAEPFDAFDVLECVRLNEVVADPEEYRETEHEGSAAVIELCALVLAARGHRTGSRPNEDGQRARPDGAIEQILHECRRALTAGSMVVFLTTIGDARGSSIQLGAVMREVHVRNLSYTHMVEDTLVGLFDDPAIEADCRQAMGCTVQEIRLVFGALADLHQQRWQHRFESLRAFAELAKAEMSKGSRPDYAITPEAKQKATELWAQTWADPADASTFDPAVIARQTGLAAPLVAKVIDLFSVDMIACDPSDAVREFFAGCSPFRTNPILRDPNGTSVVVHEGLLVPAIRDRVEQRLKVVGLWDRYAKHRGEYLEREALALLEPHFPECLVHRGFEYFVPNPDAPRPEATPPEFTKLVEGDGLLLVDDVALIVEAKAGALTDLSRTGDAKRLASDLRKIVTAATEQAERVRDRIHQDRGLRLRDDSWLDLDHVREVHEIAVSLDDLSGIATMTSELVREGILSMSHLPWTVSLHDLRIVAELVERPAELLLYLRRRTEPDVTRRFHAVDELDFFLEFYASGLYVEPDPDRVQTELPQFGEPGVAARRRFKKQQLEFLTSRTDHLDAWYLHQTGIRDSPAPKPCLNANVGVCALVDALASRRDAGWLRVGATLLDASAQLQRMFARYASDLLKASTRDGVGHTYCVIGGSRAENGFAMVWASLGANEREVDAEKRLAVYVTAKKHQLRVAWGVGLLFASADPTIPIFTTYDNRLPGEDRRLDEVVSKLNLRPVERSTDSVPRPRRPGRTTQAKR